MFVFLSFPSSALADGHLHASLQCINSMEQGESWDTCRAMIFAPCQEYAVGGSDHLACLRAEQMQWQTLRDDELNALATVLTEPAAANMSDLMEHWYVSVATKCDAVAAGRAGISAEAALVGCDISEIAGLTSALRQCRLGQSAAEFCKRKD
jgi:hypothetical protein